VNFFKFNEKVEEEQKNQKNFEKINIFSWQQYNHD